MTPFFSYGILINFNKEILKNIATNKNGTKASWDKMREATSIKKMDSKSRFIKIAHESTLRN